MYWKGGIGTRLQSSENSVFAFFNNSLYMMTAYSQEKLKTILMQILWTM